MIHKLHSVKSTVHSAILLVSFLIGQRLHAGEMLRDVEWVRPRIAQRGTTIEVIIQGKFLEQPQDLIFYKPGIRSLSLETLPNLPNPIGLAHGGRIEEQVKAVLEIDQRHRYQPCLTVDDKCREADGRHWIHRWV